LDRLEWIKRSATASNNALELTISGIGDPGIAAAIEPEPVSANTSTSVNAGADQSAAACGKILTIPTAPSERTTLCDADCKRRPAKSFHRCAFVLVVRQTAGLSGSHDNSTCG